MKLFIKRSKGYPSRNYDLYDHDHFTIGRGLDNNLTLIEKEVSRYHAMIFRFNGSFYLLDYSLNGTFYNPLTEDFDEKGTRLEKVTVCTVYQDCKTRRQSEDLARQELRKEKIPKLPGYEPHKFEEKSDMEYVIDMTKDPNDAEVLALCGRKLAKGGYIGIQSQSGPVTLTLLDV